MNRVCGDKQSVAERASAHRIRVRDLAADSSRRARILCTKRGRELTIPTWYPRFFEIGDPYMPIAAWLLDPDTGSVIYSGYCSSNYIVAIVIARMTTVIIVIIARKERTILANHLWRKVAREHVHVRLKDYTCPVNMDHGYSTG
jgi:hypothetical protein